MSTLYATLADLVSRYGAEIDQVADRDGDGVADAAVVDGVLADVSAEVDSYLAVRYQLPLADPVPLLISRLACVLARERLAYQAGIELGPDNATRREADAARKTLRDLSTGAATIGVTPAPATAAGTVQIVSGGRDWARTVPTSGTV